VHVPLAPDVTTVTGGGQGFPVLDRRARSVYDERMDSTEPLAIVTAPGAVRLERHLPRPLERVWEYLSVPALRATWLAGGPLEGRAGGAMSARFEHHALSHEPDEAPLRYRHEVGHELRGTVTAWEPPHRLRHTWDDEGEGSEVTFEARPGGGDVHLVVTHRRLDGRDTLISVAAGWHTHLAILRARLEGREPPGFWREHAKWEARYAEAFAAQPERLAPEGAGRLTATSDGSPLLSFVRDFDRSTAAVWRAVTEPDALDRWYPTRLRFEPHAGGVVRQTFEGVDVEASYADLAIPDGRVLTFDPPRVFSFLEPGDRTAAHAAMRFDQVLTCTLAPRGGGTRLTFEHAFGDRAMTASFAAGWHVCLAALEGVVVGNGSAVDTEVVRAAYDAWFGDGA
jgi:uncharacterized protein YndB with AHSA1/START domain